MDGRVLRDRAPQRRGSDARSASRSTRPAIRTSPPCRRRNGTTSTCRSSAPATCWTACSTGVRSSPGPIARAWAICCARRTISAMCSICVSSPLRTADWKPFLAHILGFDAQFVALHYEKEDELKKKQATAQTIKNELGGFDRGHQQDRGHLAAEAAGSREEAEAARRLRLSQRRTKTAPSNWSMRSTSESPRSMPSATR